MERITFETSDGLLLEGEIRRPDGEPVGAAVLLHPHPMHGGGVTEVADGEAAVDVARSAVSGPVVVCGWSFGTHVALRLAVRDRRVAALALLGFPTAPDREVLLPPLPGDDELALLDRPVLLVAGDEDPYCPVPELRALARRLPKAAVTVVKGTGHFFPKREREVARIVGRFAEAAVLSR
jgi:pimeloyl-ACP methyl ester carboxylesterase